jgi:hypothetical protein
MARAAIRWLGFIRPNEIAMASETSSAGTSRVYKPTASPFSHAEVMRVIFGVMICILLAALDQTAVVPAIPAIAG